MIMRVRVWKQSYNNLEIASNAAAFKVRCTSANLAMDGLRETRQLDPELAFVMFSQIW